MTLQQILGSIAALSVDERLTVAAAALGIADVALEDGAVESAWIAECEARLRDIDAGSATVDAAEVFARWRRDPAA